MSGWSHTGPAPVVYPTERLRLCWSEYYDGQRAHAEMAQGTPTLGNGFANVVATVELDRHAGWEAVGAQLYFTPNWSLLAKFDGEFAKVSQTYAGSGTLRYTW